MHFTSYFKQNGLMRPLAVIFTENFVLLAAGSRSLSFY